MCFDVSGGGKRYMLKIAKLKNREKVCLLGKSWGEVDVETIALLITITIKILFYFLHCSSPEIIQICKFICFKIIREFRRCQKHKKNCFATYWLRLDGWRNKKSLTRAPLNDVQTHSYLKASIEAEKRFLRD